ncbi:hypothetical protein J2Z42_001412 [Clostridium algifaecis]|uniref:Helix-turn-helix conjugative transposon-like domain-containing protein n=1 Tax=Clostridium algifaecis TaxID=1472040 RepID=A0ABS4KRS9_9CLOT|nr:hypothetical protein [Clostridium algifaecis]
MLIIEELLKSAGSGDENSMNKILEKFTHFIIKKAWLNSA